MAEQTLLSEGNISVTTARFMVEGQNVSDQRHYVSQITRATFYQMADDPDRDVGNFTVWGRC